MTRLASDLVDVDALWHVAAYSFLGTLALVLSFGTLTVAYDRSASGARRGAWPVVMVASAGLCLAIVAFGVWAITQKP